MNARSEVSERFVIINADDFGLSEGVNEGIVEAHERGIVTSASLMVRYPAATAAAIYARVHPALSVGLHFELGESRYEEGEWKSAYQVVDAKNPAAIRAELDRQLSVFERLMERPPTHLDSHQHVHQSEPSRAIFFELARRISLPLRGCEPAINHRGSFYGQTAEGEPFAEGISAARLYDLIKTLEPGWTEIGCHPGYARNLDSVYLSEREEELRVLCSANVRRAVREREIRLCSFGDYLGARKMEPSVASEKD